MAGYRKKIIEEIIKEGRKIRRFTEEKKKEKE